MDGLTWTPVDVAASLREFYPNAASPLSGDWLVGGYTLVNGTAPVRPAAWLGRDGAWAPVTVPLPASLGPDGSSGSWPSRTVLPA